MSNPVDVEKLIEVLKDRNIIKLSKGVGIHYNTIYRFINRITQPKTETIAKIINYLQRNAL